VSTAVGSEFANGRASQVTLLINPDHILPLRLRNKFQQPRPLCNPIQRLLGFGPMLLRHPCELPDDFIFVGWVTGTTSLSPRRSRRRLDFNRPASCEQELLDN